ncbi:MAG: DUF1549 domain-containing protein [Planctomycetales bacterium]|nr:DUF1549 domain-containing protein [Planctomycetales bacterium]
MRRSVVSQFGGFQRATRLTSSLALCLAVFGTLNLAQCEDKPDQPAGKVSYRTQIKPIFQAHCQGCHQPAKAGGDYVMTDFARLLKGGESESAAVVPHKSGDSNLVDLITPAEGKAEMPKGKAPLSAAEVELIRAWIDEGAENDDASVRVAYNEEHPPAYRRAPVLTSIDYSPDGKLLAVAGYHEIRLLDAANGTLQARLIGLSPRIESVQFSPDGKQLLATGGIPAQMGEVQIWDVEKKKLALSVPVTYDTVYGGSWSPDGKQVAFGCADNSVRAIDVATGKEVLFQGAHNDWVRDTVYSSDGSHLISVSRDMTCKLTEVATERFVDNITSITPKALKGGISAVVRHPDRDEIVIGGADGVTKVYRVFRITARRIGDDANMIRQMPELPGRVFDVDVSRDGKRIASVSSLDGVAHVSVCSYEFDTNLPDNIKAIDSKTVQQRSQKEKEILEEFHRKNVRQLFTLEIPASAYTLDLHPESKLLAVGAADGQIRVYEVETGKLVTEFASVDQIEPMETAGQQQVDYIRDISPVLARLGCNQGTCHGAAKGKNGFKLSLRGYDPVFDIRALTDDLASRRVNVASPGDSLMLSKPLGAVPHEGGKLLDTSDPYYQLLHDWIAAGAKLDLSTPRVTSIKVLPVNPIVEREDQEVPMTVIATYADGTTREVTREAFLESGNTEVATVDRRGVMTSIRRGEAPVLARFEGAYAATTLTVMGNRDGFTWQQPEVWGKVDELVAAKWQRMKVLPSELCSDSDFIRRVTLDLTGLPPTAERVQAFLDDERPTREKRAALVDELIGSPAFVDYWTNKWADLLQVNRKFLGPEGAQAFRDWIRSEIDKNTPYNLFAKSIIEASGSNRENPAASYYKVLRTPEDTMENTTQLFLAVRFSCNKCHDHPFERWTQDQYYETAAYFARVSLKADPESKDRRIGGTAVEGAKPYYEIVFDNQDGEVKHERTGNVTAPEFPFECSYDAPKDASRRQELSAWLTSETNPYFAASYVNRLWGYLLGTGLIEPIDDIRAGNPATNPDLLKHLTDEFIASNFDVRHVMRMICNSRTYQLGVETNEWNADDTLNYSHAQARRLPAEVLYDSIHLVTGAQSKIPGVPAGTRAAALPDSGISLPDNFLNNFGRPARESACECERSNGMQLGPVMALVSGPTLGNAISDSSNSLAKLVAEVKDDKELVNQLLMRVLNRPATESEVQAMKDLQDAIAADHEALTAALAKREQWWIDEKPKLEAQQQQALKDATAELAEYEKSIADKRTELEKAREAAIVKAEEELKQYQADEAKRVADFATKQKTGAEWHLLAPATVSSTGKMTLRRQQDRSIVAAGDEKKAVYTITTETSLPSLHGIRLEAMQAPIKGGGPGLPENGNFVVTELELFVAPKSKPDQFTKVELAAARADFSQESFDPAQAIDGVTNDQKGWAVHPAGGVDHWATFELKTPIENKEAVVLKFVIHQQHNAERHLLAKFRLSATTTPKGWGLSLPESLASLLSVPAKQQTEEDKQQLARYLNAVDNKLREQQTKIAEAKKPVPEDGGVTQRKAVLARLGQPIKDDALLLQLRTDLEQSKGQLANPRLTAVQDLTWALINSPAFLFNH